MRAIKETGHDLVAAMDPHDSVGILDSYFPDCRFFTDSAQFEGYLSKLLEGHEKDRVKYLSICTPNFLHFEHVQLALKLGASAICEKPLVINPSKLIDLEEAEAVGSGRIFSIFQLRLHPALIKLRKSLESDPDRKRVEIVLKYVTRRGPWYLTSWKGEEEKSGGLMMNIGIHFFDAMIWMFGKVEQSEVYYSSPLKMAGALELKWARIKWFLSVDINDLPESYQREGKPAFRSITMEDQELEFSDGFTDLHTLSYKEILAGKGFGVDDARPAIELVDRIRKSEVISRPDFIGEFLRK